MATNPINLASVMKSFVDSSINTSNPFIIAKVKTPPPALTIEFAGQTIPSSLIYCSNYLLPEYKREYRIDGNIDYLDLTVNGYNLVTSGSTTQVANGPDPHTHGINGISSPAQSGQQGQIKGVGPYKTSGEIWFTDTLTEGAEVLAIKVGDMFVVTNRIVKMESEALQGGA